MLFVTKKGEISSFAKTGKINFSEGSYPGCIIMYDIRGWFGAAVTAFITATKLSHVETG